MSLFLSEPMISNAFWTELDNAKLSPELDAATQNILSHTATIVSKFSPKTGSVSVGSMRAIWSLSRYFLPSVIVEVGTYIGRTTLAATYGALPSIKKVNTCDISFDCWEAPENLDKDLIKYFGKTSSTEMLRTIEATTKKVDMFILDGRIQHDDIKLIAGMRHSDTVFLVDDFEGVEKGIENALLLRSAFPDLVLITPPVTPRSGWSAGHCIATLISGKKITLTRQQCLPFHMM